MSALEWSVYNRSNLRQAIHLRSGTLVPTYGRKTPSLGLRTLYPVPAVLPSGHCLAHTSCRAWRVRDEEDELLWVLTAGDQGRHTIPPEGAHRVLRYDRRLREFAREHQFKRLMHGRPSLVVANEFRCLKYSLEQGMHRHIRHKTS